MACSVLNERRHLGLQQLSALAETGRSFLGPAKATKFVVDEEQGESVLTSSPLRLLESLDLRSAVGQLLLEAVQAQSGAHGCGTSTLLFLAGAWARAAAECLQQGVPVSTIAEVMAEGLEACTAEAAALYVPVHVVLDPVDRRAWGPGEAGLPPPTTEDPAAPGCTWSEDLDCTWGEDPDCTWGEDPAAPDCTWGEDPDCTWSEDPDCTWGEDPAAPDCTWGEDPDCTWSEDPDCTWGEDPAAPDCTWGEDPDCTWSEDPEPEGCTWGEDRPGGAAGPGARALRHSRHLGAGRARGCGELGRLAAGLSRGQARAMALAEAALRLQGARAPDPGRVCLCLLAGRPEAASGVCAGYVAAVPAALGALARRLQGRRLRVVLLDGALAGPAAGADGALRALARLGAALVLARGAVCPLLAARAAGAGRLLLGGVHGRALRAFAEATGAAPAAGLARLGAGGVGRGAWVARWPGAGAVRLGAAGLALSSAVLAGPAALLPARADALRAGLARLQCALAERRVLPGGGAVELRCVGLLRGAAGRAERAGRPGRAAALRGLAGGWRAFLGALRRNAGRGGAPGPQGLGLLDAGAPGPQGLGLLDAGAPGPQGLGLLDAGAPGPQGLGLLDAKLPGAVLDPAAPKLEAWRRALDLVLLVLRTDCEVLTGPGPEGLARL